jgi:hypothetical protein
VVLAVDDDDQVLYLLACLLGARFHFIINIFEYAIDQIDLGLSPVFVLLDLHISPGQTADGLLCLGSLCCAGYLRPVLILSSEPSFYQTAKAFHTGGGANGYILKTDLINLRVRPERLLFLKKHGVSVRFRSPQLSSRISLPAVSTYGTSTS